MAAGDVSRALRAAEQSLDTRPVPFSLAPTSVNTTSLPVRERSGAQRGTASRSKKPAAKTAARPAGAKSKPGVKSRKLVEQKPRNKAR